MISMFTQFFTLILCQNKLEHLTPTFFCYKNLIYQVIVEHPLKAKVKGQETRTRLTRHDIVHHELDQSC
jgi:hypothetical protein